MLEALYVDLVAHHLVVGADLAAEENLATAQRPACPQRASPQAVEPEKLPDGIDTEAARLDRVAGQVALEVQASRRMSCSATITPGGCSL